ncbi:MAG: flagellar motor switch protein FliN [Candidatus Manganitrophaceae bacterium]|nr:MAG: flagellar motor switch protein FliN [Candidatus Manganitrophaceae bacterium]
MTNKAADPGGGKAPLKTEAKAAQFSPIEQKPSAASARNLDFILNVPLKINVQIGSSRMMVRDLLQLSQGSVIELEKFAGEAMDVLIGDKLVARGEVVVVNEKYGIRLTDVVTPVERIKQLNKE